MQGFGSSRGLFAFPQILDGFDDTWFQRIDQVLNKGKEDPESGEGPVRSG
jgi:hypothetical protein